MTYPATQTFWLEPTDRIRYSLRRYTHWDNERPEHTYHSAQTLIGDRPATFDTERHTLGLIPDEQRLPRNDARWPTTCDCGYVFTADDVWQHFQELIYRRSDTGEEWTLRDAPPGASWDAWWMPFSRGPDGIYLMVRCPNGRDWAVDSEARNCTRPGEPHECWVRHGDPRECHLTVDKAGDTCTAGAGSIQAGDYHGFLQNGVLTAG